MSDTALALARMLWEERMKLMRTALSISSENQPDSISQIYRAVERR